MLRTTRRTRCLSRLTGSYTYIHRHTVSYTSTYMHVYTRIHVYKTEAGLIRFDRFISGNTETAHLNFLTSANLAEYFDS